MAGPIAQFLTDDHRRLTALLVRATAAEDAIDVASFEAFREGLLRHIAMEEKVLLPEARRRGAGVPLPMMARLRIDHAALVALLLPPPAAPAIAELRAILAEHDVFEEAAGGLYETCEALAGDDAPSWVERMRALPPVPVSAPVDGPRVRAHIARRLAERAQLLRAAADPDTQK